ncbi:MAG: type 1 glutamine amidotransferase [Candidatus Aminicenantia bacterium]
MKKITIIDNSINYNFYSPVEHWKPYFKGKLILFKAIKNEFPNLRENCTHLLLTGSESTIMERPEWVLKEIEVIQEAVRIGVPVLGSCYGHQLLAFALSGPEVVRHSSKPEIGWIKIDILKPQGIFEGMNKEIYSFSSHFDEVWNLPQEYEILASSPDCEVQAFQYDKKPVWGIQFHPEIDIQTAQKFLEKGRYYMKEHAYLFEKALNSTPKDSKITQKIIDNFLKF